MRFRRPRTTIDALRFATSMPAMLTELGGELPHREIVQIFADEWQIPIDWSEASAVAHCRDADVQLEFDELGRLARWTAQIPPQ